MSEAESSTEWAQLVCSTDVHTPPYMISKDKFTIGRAAACDISHENNKLVSGVHCYILRDDGGKVWLYDTSTNGTLLNNKTKVSKGKCQELEHGDEFFIIFKKAGQDVNIGYVYQDLARLKEEEEADDSGELEQTQEYDAGPPELECTIADENINLVDAESPRTSQKRRLSPHCPEENAGPASKKTRADKEDESKDNAAAISPPDSSKPGGKGAAKSDGGKAAATGAEEKGKEEGASKGEAAKSDGKGGGEGEKVKGDGVKEGEEEEDAFADTLTCIICQELLHDCISLQPCMHAFCAGCYSEWMAHSSDCPSCRTKVDRINKNHIVNNLVEAYLKEHPGKRRPEEDIKELDAKNKITRDMLYPDRRRRSSSEYDDSDEDDDAESAPGPTFYRPNPAPGTIFGFGTPFLGAFGNAYRAMCRQCPGSNNQPTNLVGSAVNVIKNIFTGNQGSATTAAATTTTTTAATTSTDASSSGAGPSTSGNNNNNNANQASSSTLGTPEERDRKVMPVAPDYVCRPNQNHVLCQCCLQIFPDRRPERLNNLTIPPQQCMICLRAFCHAYWGCRKADCNGCLAKFKDMSFGKKVLPALILENPHESDIFKNYLESQNLAVRDVLETCLAKMAEGAYSCPDQVRYNLNGESPLCFPCALRNFKSLAYQYRADIPRNQLPDEVRARSNCYWGKNCRTQRNKPAHAMRFNHICEQTRT